MTGRERVLTALSHKEPDRVPYDLSGTHVTGISVGAHDRLRKYLSLPDRRTDVVDLLQQLAMPADDLMDRLKVDTRGLYPLCSNNIPLPVGSENWRELITETNEGLAYVDEWGFRQFMPSDGLYFSLVQSPLPDMDVSVEQVMQLPLPDGSEALISTVKFTTLVGPMEYSLLLTQKGLVLPYLSIILRDLKGKPTSAQQHILVVYAVPPAPSSQSPMWALPSPDMLARHSASLGFKPNALQSGP